MGYRHIVVTSRKMSLESDKQGANGIYGLLSRQRLPTDALAYHGRGAGIDMGVPYQQISNYIFERIRLSICDFSSTKTKWLF